MREERFGIVLDGRDLAGNAELVALEVDQAQLLLVAAAVVAHGHVDRSCAAAGALLDCQQRLVRLVRRDVVVDQRRLEAERWGDRSKCLNRHRLLPAFSFSFQLGYSIAGVIRRSAKLIFVLQPRLPDSADRLQVVDVVRHLLALLQANVCLLPVRPVAGKLAPAALFADKVRGANTGDLDLEESFDGLLHFGLGRLGGHFEDQRVLRSPSRPCPFP